MNSSSLGLPVPVTSTFALPLTLYYFLLQVRVVSARIATKTTIAPSSASVKPGGNDDPLLAAFRTQANFAENVPLALILAGLVEINGGSKTLLSIALSALVAARVAHAEFGLMAAKSEGIGRPIGFFGTFVINCGLAIYGAWLASGHWTA